MRVNIIRIKICGITHKEDALMACKMGAWALGFVFYKKSPRFIPPIEAKKIIKALPPFVVPVGVFVNENEAKVQQIADFCHLRALQFQGEEPPGYCRRFKGYKIIKAVRVKERLNWSQMESFEGIHYYLLDAYEPGRRGGTGKTFNWEILKHKRLPRPFILSGGLNPQNVAQAFKSVSPYAVDVSSGVERSPGRKDERLLAEFFGNASQ